MPLVHTITPAQSLSLNGYVESGGGLYSNEKVFFQIYGTFTGTLTFQCSLDRVNWIPMGVFPLDGGGGNGNQSSVSSTTAPGMFVTPTHPYWTRVICTALTSGNPLVISDKVSNQ